MGPITNYIKAWASMPPSHLHWPLLLPMTPNCPDLDLVRIDKLMEVADWQEAFFERCRDTRARLMGLVGHLPDRDRYEFVRMREEASGLDRALEALDRKLRVWRSPSSWNNARHRFGPLARLTDRRSTLARLDLARHSLTFAPEEPGAIYFSRVVAGMVEASSLDASLAASDRPDSYLKLLAACDDPIDAFLPHVRAGENWALFAKKYPHRRLPESFFTNLRGDMDDCGKILDGLRDFLRGGQQPMFLEAEREVAGLRSLLGVARETFESAVPDLAPPVTDGAIDRSLSGFAKFIQEFSTRINLARLDRLQTVAETSGNLHFSAAFRTMIRLSPLVAGALLLFVVFDQKTPPAS